MKLRLLAMGLSAAFGVRAAEAQLHIGKDNRTLEVTGVGTASAEPEIAKLHVGFKVYSASSKDGYQKASDLSNAIVKALTNAGAAKGDIESEDQAIAPLADYELQQLPASLKTMQFRVSQSWTVRVAIDQVAKMLNPAVEAGANASGQVQWLMKDATALEQKAMSRATARARALAEEMAAGMGVKLGPLLHVTTQEPYVLLAGARDAVAMDKAGAAPLSIEARRVERSITVRAVYSIE